MLHKYYGIPKDASWKGFMERFPILFQDSKKPMNQTCMCWGIECPIGWYHILEQLCTVLEYYNIEFSKNHGLAIIADQVKEKFGTLRFYFTVREVDKDGVEKDPDPTEDSRISTEENKRRILMDYLELLADQIIEEAENLTENTCADCGVPLDRDNKVETKGWITYICKECDEKRKGKMESDEEVCAQDEEEPTPDQDVKEEE